MSIVIFLFSIEPQAYPKPMRMSKTPARLLGLKNEGSGDGDTHAESEAVAGVWCKT